jgi:very-short-patch-repair endonuclease
MSPPRSGIFNTQSKQPLRRKLRKSLTPAEALLWKNLQNRQLLGKKFRRQASIYRYIVDFYCPECRVIVELDGAAHYSVTRDAYEEERTKYLEAQGLKVIRFENRDVFENLDGVLETIRQNLQAATSS